MDIVAVSQKGDFVIKLGDVIYKCRKNLNLSRPALARELGVTARFLENLELGLTEEVTLDFLNRILLLLDIPVQHILESIRFRPELAMYLAVQNILSTRVPPESLNSIYQQVMAMLNKLGEIWLKCPSVEEMAMWNGLVLRNLESLDSFLRIWHEELSQPNHGNQKNEPPEWEVRW